MVCSVTSASSFWTPVSLRENLRFRKPPLHPANYTKVANPRKEQRFRRPLVKNGSDGGILSPRVPKREGEAVQFAHENGTGVLGGLASFLNYFIFCILLYEKAL